MRCTGTQDVEEYLKQFPEDTIVLTGAEGRCSWGYMEQIVMQQGGSCYKNEQGRNEVEIFGKKVCYR